jgi:hypothetical protein
MTCQRGKKGFLWLIIVCVVTALSVFLKFLPLAQAAVPGAPSGLRVELNRNAGQVLMAGTRTPKFGWILNDSDKNEKQTGCQILVASSQSNIDSNIGDIWDSGKLVTEESTNVQYAGSTALTGGNLYYWKVRTWDKDSNVSPYSVAEKFMTSLDAVQWTAKPIWAGGGDFCYLRKTITLPAKTIKNALAYLTGLSPRTQSSPVYKLYINGNLVGVGPTRHYNGSGIYDGYEVGGFLNPGASNLLAAMCEANDTRKFLLQLKITYTDGAIDTFITDNTWKSFNAQTVYNPHGTRSGQTYYTDPYEDIDARNMPFGWMGTGFDDTAWAAATEASVTYSDLTASPKSNLVIEEITPTRVYSLGNNSYRAEFDKGYFGWLKVRFDNATSGDYVEIYGEKQTNDWSFIRYEGWVLKAGSQTIEESGYNWIKAIEIRGYDGSDTLDGSKVKLMAIRSVFDDNAASFTSSNWLLDMIYGFCKQSIKTLDVDVYWDCPTRERIPYEGGNIINQYTHFTMDSEYTLARYSNEYNLYYPTWPEEYKEMIPVMIWDEYMYTGNHDSMGKYWSMIKQRVHSTNANNLCTTHALVDWPAVYNDGYDLNTTTDNVLTAWNYAAYKRLADMADVLGNTSERDTYAAKANSILNSFNATYYNSSAGTYIDGEGTTHTSIHSAIIGGTYGMIPGSYQSSVGNYLNNKAMACGVYGSQFFLWTLYNLERGQKAFDLITSTATNSTYNMIYNLKLPATGEAWDPTGKGNMTNCHAWGSAAGNMIQRGLMGINPLEPGFKKISIKPQTASLKSASIDMPTIKGTVHVDIGWTGTTYTLTTNIPVNTTAKVYVPMMGPSGVSVAVDGTAQNGTQEGSFIFFDNIGSGSHTFARTTSTTPGPTPTYKPTPSFTPVPLNPPVNTPTPTPRTDNLAVGKTMTATSNQSSYPPSYANDEDTNTFWVSQDWPETITQYLTCNLGGTYNVNEVWIYPRANYGPKDTTVEVSTNGTSFTQVVASTALTNGDGPYILTFTATNATHVRLKVTTSYSTQNTQVREFKIFQPQGATPTPTPLPWVNLARAGTASASSIYSSTYSADKANDGDITTTRWNAVTGSGVGEWLQIDFASNTTFDRTICREAYNRITGYKIQYYNGSSWIDAYTGTAMGAAKTDTFTAVTALKIRMYITGISGGSPSLYELEVYNGSGATPTPTPTPVATATPTPTPAVTVTPTPTPLLTDDFSGDLSKWTAVSSCAIESGELSLNNSGYIESVSGSGWTNYTLECDVNIKTNSAGINFRVNDGNNYYMQQVSSNLGKLRLHKKAGGTFAVLKEVACTFNLNTTYHIKIVASGSTISTYVDGVLKDTTTDTTFTGGKVGFRQGSTEHAHVDNVKVY